MSIGSFYRRISKQRITISDFYFGKTFLKHTLMADNKSNSSDEIMDIDDSISASMPSRTVR
jgi:hypothetical protein